jgi:hypothetical protein
LRMNGPTLILDNGREIILDPQPAHVSNDDFFLGPPPTEPTIIIVGGLGVWNAGDDTEMPPPRGWLLGNTFARKFVSSLIGDGAVGKTAIRCVQVLALATGRPLTGEHVFQRARVLIVSLEDDADELRRRILAAMMHYKITHAEVKGWLFLSAPGGRAGKLISTDQRGRTIHGPLADKIKAEIIAHKIDLILLDPFVKTHSVEENSNSAVDDVVQILTDLAAEHDLAVDVPHHVSKGAADPGNADRGRGASAMKDAGRLIYTATTMSADEARAFGIEEAFRKTFVRIDSGKVNITKTIAAARWFRLIGVPSPFRRGRRSDDLGRARHVERIQSKPAAERRRPRA